MLTKALIDAGTKSFKELHVVRRLPLEFVVFEVWHWAFNQTGSTLDAEIIMEKARGRTLYN